MASKENVIRMYTGKQWQQFSKEIIVNNNQNLLLSKFSPINFSAYYCCKTYENYPENNLPYISIN
jgi:hypothetical protein